MFFAGTFSNQCFYLEKFNWHPLMKLTHLSTFLIATVLTVTTCSEASAQWGGSVWSPGFGGWGRGVGGWGSGWSSWNRPGQLPPTPSTSLIGRVAIEGDVNYSGVIDLGDYRMGKEAKFNPYGLIIGVGEMAKLQLTCKPNAERQKTVGEPQVRMEFHRLVASLELQGINLGHPKGRFASYGEEVAQCGRVRVWMDHTRRMLLLDSSDPGMRRVEWPFATSVPPERVFVESVEPSAAGAAFILTMELDDSNRRGLSKLFSEPAVWDRQLISTKVPGIHKPRNDRTPVWSVVGSRGK